jgi:FMN-dependent NADH-azoreductase
MQRLLFMLHLMTGGNSIMSTLIQFDSSPMGERSISRKLTADFARTWLKARPGSKIVTRDLSALNLQPINAFWAASAHTPEESLTEEQKKALAVSESLIGDLKNGDEYVFGVPMHNFGIPSTLKLWIDQVVRAGKTFSYTANGPVGLLEGKKATILIASGGVYEEGTNMASFNFVAPYLQTVFGFIGITDLTIISAGGTAQLMSGKVDTHTFLAPTLEKVHAHASL